MRHLPARAVPPGQSSKSNPCVISRPEPLLRATRPEPPLRARAASRTCASSPGQSNKSNLHVISPRNCPHQGQSSKLNLCVISPRRRPPPSAAPGQSSKSNLCVISPRCLDQSSKSNLYVISPAAVRCPGPEQQVEPVRHLGPPGTCEYSTLLLVLLFFNYVSCNK